MHLTGSKKRRVNFEKNTTNVSVEHYVWFEFLRFLAFLSNVLTFIFAIVLFARNTWWHETIFISIASATLLLDLLAVFSWRIVLYIKYKDYFRPQGVLFRGRIDSIGERQLKDPDSTWKKKYGDITIKLKYRYFFFLRIETHGKNWQGNNLQIIFSAPLKRIDIYFENRFSDSDKKIRGHAKINLHKEKISVYTDPNELISKAEFHRFAHKSIENKKDIDNKIKKY